MPNSSSSKDAPPLSRRDFLRLAGVASVGGVLAACSPIPLRTNQRTGEKVQLVYQDTREDWFLPMVQEMLGKFHATHPNIQVFYTPEPDGPQNKEEKMLEDMQAGTAPDVFQGCCSWFPIWAQKGYTFDLRPFVEADLDQATIDEWDSAQYQALFTQDGLQYGLPKYHGALALYYNQDLFDEFDVSYPDENWDHDDYLEAMKRLSHPKDSAGQNGLWGSQVYITWDRIQMHINGWGPSGGFTYLAGRLSLSESGLGTLIHTLAPLVWEVRASAVDMEIKRALLKEGVEQVLSIPLQVKGRLAGVIQLGSCQVREYTPEVLDLLAAIGRHVGVAVENARLHQVVQQTVALEERARLARELHDSVTQSLYSVTLLAEAAARLLIAGESQTAADHLRELRDTAQESLREMRLLIYELRPVALGNSGLADALRLRLEAVEARSGIKADLQVEGEERLSYETKVELYQIAQETLNNILKHSHARQVQIHLQFIDGMTCLEVIDDGIGFNTQEASRGGGLGLAGMVERVQKIGGKLQINSTPGLGTRIRVEAGNLVRFKEV